MDNPLESVKSVPVWVWLLLGVVVFIAFTSHSASQTGGATLSGDDGAQLAADSQLQQTEIAARTTLGVRILDIAGALDLANIDASTHRHDTDAALEAVKIQNQPPPPQVIDIHVTGAPTGTTPTKPAPQPVTVNTLCGPGMRPSWSPFSGMHCVPVAASAQQSNAALSDFTRDSSVAFTNVRRTVRGVLDGAAGGVGSLLNGPSVY